MKSAACIVFGLCFVPYVACAGDVSPIRIVLAGDSTVTDMSGWGSGIRRCFIEPIKIINLSQSGSSSKSFRDEGHWKGVLDSNAEYVLIQFGHNDQPGKGPNRETLPDTTYRENITRYVEEALAMGATPVLVTSLSRRKWGADDRIHSTLTPYVDVVRQIATEKDIPLVDLHQRSITAYQSLGRSGCGLISPKKDDGSVDGTHLNKLGAKVIGPIVADDLRRLCPEISRYFRPLKSVPAKVHDYSEARGRLTLTVAADGSGEYRTLQEAIDAVPDYREERTTILMKPGTYYGPVTVPFSKTNVAIQGESAENTIVTFALNIFDPLPATVPYIYRGSGTIVLGDGFHASNITFENTSGNHGAAMALYVEGDRAVFDNCRIIGWQDTLRASNCRQYYSNCYIAGRGDFIYGAATAVFDHCTICSRDGGYVTAASTPAHFRYGFVFLDCQLTSDDGKRTFLGRPWRPYAYVAFLRCEMGPHIRPEGWHNWKNPKNEHTARYFEYQNTGLGATPEGRVGWSQQLTDEEAIQFTPQEILKGSDDWDPTNSTAEITQRAG